MTLRMDNMKNPRVKLVFYRTLFSQSAGSLTMALIAAVLRQHKVPVDLCLLEQENRHSWTAVFRNDGSENLVVIAKPNFKDYGYMFSMLRAMREAGLVSRVFLCGPYAALNAKRLVSENVWLDGAIIDQVEVISERLIDLLRHGESLAGCEGGIWREDGVVME